MRLRTWFGPTAEAAVLSLCVALCASSAPRWNIQYFYDHADSNFAIEDLQCPTPRHCVAGGLIDDKKGHEQGTVVVSNDAGLHWSQYEVKERPLSLFFLNESLGWMVTDRGLWSTLEGGRSWTKIQSRKGILQTLFLDEHHGYITGLKGLLEETTDGGKSWSKLAASEKLANVQDLNFDVIEFRGQHGVIIGAPQPADPDAIAGRPERSTVSVLETVDGGRTWNSGVLTMEGDMAQLKLSDKGFIVSLILYSNPKYPVGSAVYQAQLGARQGRVIFAERDRVATDVALLDNGSAVLAAIEPPGNSIHAPIPGKLKMFETSDLKVWQEMDVDYRVVAQRAVIAVADDRNIWVATDTGAILKLSE